MIFWTIWHEFWSVWDDFWWRAEWSKIPLQSSKFRLKSSKLGVPNDSSQSLDQLSVASSSRFWRTYANKIEIQRFRTETWRKISFNVKFRCFLQSWTVRLHFRLGRHALPVLLDCRQPSTLFRAPATGTMCNLLLTSGYLSTKSSFVRQHDDLFLVLVICVSS